jgi:peptidyl-prolyl cis-trans isomerase SurA
MGQVKEDTVLFTIDNTPILASEFIRVYHKNLNLIKDESQKDVDEYLKLFINYKLKLKEARTLNFDKKPQYIREFENYKKQLSKNYLTDHKVTDALVKEAYERFSYEIKVSHLLIKLPEHEQDTAVAYSKILKLRERLLNEDFGNLQNEFQKSDVVIAEDLGYFSGFKMDYAFENVAFNTKLEEVSQPFRTAFGYHVLKVFDKRNNRGEVTVGHIMIAHHQKDTLVKPEVRIQDLHKLIQQGKNFESLAKQFSDDKGSSTNGGKLSPIKSGQLRSVEFEDLAFGLKEIGDISAPFKTDFGWHIVKLYGKKPMVSFDEMKFDLEARVRRDARSKLINKAMINKLKKKYNVVEANADLAYFTSIINDEFFKRNWAIPSDLIVDKPFLKIQNKQLNYGDFAAFLLKSQHKIINKGTAKDIISKLYSDFRDSEILTFHEENLEFENLEYAEILDEYRSGLLLFDLMETKIWNAVKQDTVGLKNFFLEHSTKYRWDERIDAIVATCSKEKDIDLVRAMLKNGKIPDSISKQINVNNAQNVIFTVGIMAKDHQALPENLEFKTGVSGVFVYNDAFHVIDIKGVLPESGKKFEESRGRVISDYQDEVEKKWIQDLEKKYVVKLNNEVLTEIKSLIHNN